MALVKHSLKTTHAHQKKRLDQILAEWLPDAIGRPVSKGAARKLIVAGAVYLNGKRVRIASKEILANAKIDVYVDLAKLSATGPSRDRAFVLSPERVLFEDDHLIAVDKPPGLPTQPTLDEARDNLFAAVKRYLGGSGSARGGGDPYVGLHHRLDRDTSGVVLFTKSKEANPGIAEAFRSHAIQKIYHAIARGGSEPPKQWSVENFLGRAQTGGKRARFTAVRSGGDPARTDFRLIERLGGAAGEAGALWIEARPKTGRTHQIRVHLSEGGMPILGDEVYGSASGGEGSVPRLMLHAHELHLKHPLTGEALSIRSPLPEDFEAVLLKLRSKS